MTAPRPIFPGRICFVTRRCTQRQFLLRPDTETQQIFEYCLAEAAARFGVSILAVLAMGNHYHAVVLDNHGNLPDFLAHFHKLVAKAMNAHRKREENFWSSDAPSIVHLVQDADAFDKVVYTFTNPQAADLVDNIHHWPGASSFTLLGGTTRRVKRPRIFFRKTGSRMPPVVTLAVVTPPAWRGREGEWADCIREAVRKREDALRAARHADGRRVVGRRQVIQSSPLRAAAASERRGERSPRIACKHPAAWAEAMTALRSFLESHRAAVSRHLAGDRSVVFPPGAFKNRHLTSPAAMRATSPPD